MVCGADGVKAFWLPKPRSSLEIVNVGEAPSPRRVTVCGTGGLLPVLSLNDRVDVNRNGNGGATATATAHLPPASTVVFEHASLVILNAFGLAPVSVTLLTVRGSGVGLSKVTTWDVEVVPPGTNPKSIAFGAGTPAGAKPRPLSGRLWLPLSSLSWNTRFAIDWPAAGGVKVKPTSQVVGAVDGGLTSSVVPEQLSPTMLKPAAALSRDTPEIASGCVPPSKTCSRETGLVAPTGTLLKSGPGLSCVSSGPPPLTFSPTNSLPKVCLPVPALSVKITLWDPPATEVGATVALIVQRP